MLRKTWLFIVLSTLLLVRAPNPEIADNELGITSRACAASYCTTKDSLELWLALEWDCHQDDKVTGDGQGPAATTTETIIQAPSRGRRKTRRRLTTDASTSLSLSVTRVVTAIAASVLSVVGILTGYRVGRMLTLQEKIKARIAVSSSKMSSKEAAVSDEEESGTPSKRAREGRTFKTVSTSASSYGALSEEERDESESQLLFSHSARNLRALFPGDVAGT